MCSSNEAEDVKHFVLKCNAFRDLQDGLFATLRAEMSNDGFCNVTRLNMDLLILLLLGLKYPIYHLDLMVLRYLTCIHIHKMYKTRIELEPSLNVDV